MHTGPVLDVCWSEDGSKVFTASCDKIAKMWDLNRNQSIQIAQHDTPIKTVHWIKVSNYSCVMTGSWDKTLKLWDTRTANPLRNLQLPERCYCSGVVYPMAVLATIKRGLIAYQLENQPSEFRRIESPLKHQHRCIAIFKDKQNKPTGFALGSIEGRVAIHYINPPNPAKDNFTFKCHWSNGTNTAAKGDIYAVNGIAFHLVHGTLATVGLDAASASGTKTPEPNCRPQNSWTSLSPPAASTTMGTSSLTCPATIGPRITSFTTPRKRTISFYVMQQKN